MLELDDDPLSHKLGIFVVIRNESQKRVKDINLSPSGMHL
jgi:hypothetical protein